MIDLILKQRLLKDKKYFDKWQGIMRPGQCEGQCGKTVPHRIMSHLGEKSTDDIYRGVISGTDKGSKNRLYHAMSAPESYRYLCPTCDRKHEKNMFTENYNPVWNLDTRTRGILAERAKKAQERARIKDLRKKQKRLRYMIKSLLRKREDFDDPDPTYVDDADYSGPEDDEEYTPMEEGFGMHQENVGKPVYDTRLGFKTKDNTMTPEELKNAGKRKGLMARIARHRTPEPTKPRMGFIQDMIKEFLAKQALIKSDNPWLDDKRNTRQLPKLPKVPIKKDINKEINQFVRKFETANLPHEGTAKYKPQMDSRKRINDKLGPHAMSNRKQDVNPASAPPMGFGQKTNPEEHVVDNYVPQDKTHAFKYRGRTYDASRMTPEEIADILAEMEQQI